MDETLKRRVMFAIVAFNLTIILYQLIFNSGVFGFPFTWGKLAIGLVIAAAAAGVGYAVAQFTER
jgi:hypothetical protein